MMVSPAAITEVANFYFYVLISQRTSFVHIFFSHLLFSLFVFQCLSFQSEKILDFFWKISLEHVWPFLIDFKLSFFLIPIGIRTVLLGSTGEVWQAVRARHLDLIFGVLRRDPDLVVLFTVVGIFRFFLLSLISLLLLLQFSLSFFLLQLSKSFVLYCRLAFEKRVNISTAYIFVHGADLTSAHNFS